MARRNGAGKTDNKVSPAPPVIINFVQKEPVVIEIDPDALLWEDMEALMEVQERQDKGELTEREASRVLTDLLTKITGKDMKKQPARLVTALMAQLETITGGVADNAKNFDGNSTTTSGQAEQPRGSM